MKLRKLKSTGIKKFMEYLKCGAKGDVPIDILLSPDTSDPVEPTILLDNTLVFNDRFEFGQYLTSSLQQLPGQKIQFDRGLWTALAIVWFDQICPAINDIDNRRVRESYRYILSDDYRHHYRHLVMAPWQIVREHGACSRFLLLPPKVAPHPLQYHGEVLEQLGSRQTILRAKATIATASRLYADPITGRPKRGASGNGPGSARRLSMTLRQLGLTYDVEGMDEDALLAILPKEFDRWQHKTN